jgi:hypothetical protein
LPESELGLQSGDDGMKKLSLSVAQEDYPFNHVEETDLCRMNVKGSNRQ